MKQHDKVCIGIVNNGTMNCNLVSDLIHIAIHPNGRFDSLVQVSNIGLTTRSRNVVVKNYLEQTKAQWVLLVDSDERLTPDVFNLLCDTAHDKERKVVSGLVFAAFFDERDMLRPLPTIYRESVENGLQAIDDYPINECIEVDAVGTGCILIHRSILELMQKNTTAHQGKDWAWFVEGAIHGKYYGEDLLFSKRLRSLGVKIFAHTGAILQHQKTFWLDERHHLPLRERAIQAAQETQAQA
jgi:hypothetical protein